MSSVFSIPLPSLNFGKLGHTYTVFKRNKDAQLESVAFSCEMQFKVIDVDASSGETEDGEGFSEVYMLEELEVSTADYMAKVRGREGFTGFSFNLTWWWCG